MLRKLAIGSFVVGSGAIYYLNSRVRLAKVPNASILARERARRPDGRKEKLSNYTDCFAVKVSPGCAKLPKGTMAASLFGSFPLGALEIPLIAWAEGGAMAPHAEFYISNGALHSEAAQSSTPSREEPDGTISEVFPDRVRFSDSLALGLVDLRAVTEFHLAEARASGDVLVYARRAADGTLSGRGNITAESDGSPQPEPSAAALLDEVCFRTGEQRDFTTSTWAALRRVPPYHPPGKKVAIEEAMASASGERELEVLFGSHARMRGPLVPASIPGAQVLEHLIFGFHDLYSRAIVLAVASEVERRARELETAGEGGVRARSGDR